MAEPIQPVQTNDVDKALEWADVMALPAGKKRFQAIRARLRDYLHESADAPSVSKKFLSEKLILAVGKSGDASKLPDGLKQMLGGPEAQQAFADELRNAYSVLSGKAPKAETQAVFDAALDGMEQEGMPADKVGYLRKMGPTALVAAMGPGFVFTSAQLAKKSPEVKGVLGRLTDEAFGVGLPRKGAKPVESFGVGIPTRASTPTPTPAITEAAAPVAGEAAAAAVKGGLRSKIAGIVGKGFFPAAALAWDAYYIGSSLMEPSQERARAEGMAKTGIIPDAFGGPAVVARTAKGEPITSGQFLQMMQEREDQMKMSRFNAATHEADLTGRVMSYLSGGPDQEQRAVQRMQLGSARPAQQMQPPVDQVMKQFDTFLRQATAGSNAGGE